LTLQMGAGGYIHILVSLREDLHVKELD
jgi:hypothetical protein